MRTHAQTSGKTDAGALALRLRLNSHVDRKKELATFEAFLRNQNLKLTGPRHTIAKAALEAKRHFTADDLLDELRKHNVAGASKASVYRTLTLMSEAKLLEAHDFAKGKTYYEPIYGVPHHDHLVCLRCSKIIEFQNPTIEEAQDEVAREWQFTIISHTHKIFGLCSRCR